MTAWHYRAIARHGQVIEGAMQAPDETAVLARLRRDGARPLRIARSDGPRPRRLRIASSPDRLTRGHVAAFAHELSIMLGAGQDLDRTLRFIVEGAPSPRAARGLGALRDRVRDGSSLADAMAQAPESFTPLSVGLIRAGEAGGALAAAAADLALLLEREQRLAASLQSAMIYPLLLLTASACTVILLLTQVLPQFTPLLEQSGVALPAATRLLIDAGAAVSAGGLPALVLLALLGMLAAAALRRPGPLLAFDRMRLRLPLLGALAREALAARLARTLGSLLANRVPLITALAITRDVLGNTAGVAALDRATERARSGAGLAEPLGESGLFPPRLIHLLRLGEETAQLATLALRAAAIHEAQVHQSSQRLAALLTPAVTIVMGGVVAFIVSSLLLAMLSVNDIAK